MPPVRFSITFPQGIIVTRKEILRRTIPFVLRCFRKGIMPSVEMIPGNCLDGQSLRGRGLGRILPKAVKETVA